MVRNTLPRFAGDVATYANVITANSTSSLVFTAPTGGARVELVNFVTTNSASMTAFLEVKDIASAVHTIGALAIAAYSGTVKTAPSVDGLNATDIPSLRTDAHANKFFDLAEHWALMVSATELIATANRTLTAFVNVSNLAADS